MSNSDDPDRKKNEEGGQDSQEQDPQGTVAWNPDDMPDLQEAAATHAAELAELEEEEESEDDPLVGQLIRGKWKVLKRLGAGSFGTVYKVEDVKGGWIEALKILGVDRITGSEADVARQRFLREAQIMKRLGAESQHIVGLSTYEEDLEEGLIYFLMEFVEGRPLSAVVDQDGPFDVDRTVPLALQVCEALIVAHEGPEGVVHRDLKLENLMLTTDRTGDEMVKVLDFGIAKLAEKDADTRLTTVGTLGTPGYAAPEQIRAEDVDARTDLFAFGVILYSLLTGKDPWLGNPAAQPTAQIYELMVASDRGEVKPMKEAEVDVPPAMVQVVMKLLRRDPAQRYQSARELRDALRRIEAGALDAEVGSLRVLTDEDGVEVEIRSGRSTLKSGPTPCVANGIPAGSYKVVVTDERFEPVETVVALEAGAMEDVSVVTRPRETGVGASVRRRPGLMAAAVVLVLVAAGALAVRPWGRTVPLTELIRGAEAGSVADVRLSEVGVEGTITVAGVPAPVRVPLTPGQQPEAVEELRAAGVSVDTRWQVRQLLAGAARAQADLRYFGQGDDDVRAYARRILALDPDSEAGRSLLLKVGERMAWDAAAALEDEGPDAARELVQECLTLVPEHPRCVAIQAEL